MSYAELAPAQAEAERRVIGAWYGDQKFRRVWLPQPELFASPQHLAIAEVAAAVGVGLTENGLLLDLKRRGKLGLFDGGPGSVLELLHSVPWVADPRAELTRLRELNGARALCIGMQKALQLASPTLPLAELQNAANDAVRAASAAAGSRVVTMRSAFQTALAELNDPRAKVGCITGSQLLDQVTGGIRAGNVWVFGADTSYGKSSWLLHVADLNARRGRRVLIVTAEDTRQTYASRLLVRRAGVSAWQYRERRLDYASLQDVTAAANEPEENILILDGTGGVPCESLAADVRSACVGDGVELVLVDYLQAMRCAKPLKERRLEVAFIAREFTDAIKSCGAAGVLFSQITVDASKKVPDKHSIRESRDVSNAAEVVVLGYQEQGKDDEKPRRVLSLDKNKHGESGMRIDIGWDSVSATFLPDAGYGIQQEMYDD